MQPSAVDFVVFRTQKQNFMAEQTTALRALPVHGSKHLPAVEVDSYNLETKDDEGFIGDRVNKGAFKELLDDWRKPMRKSGDDPLGNQPTDEISKKALDDILKEGDPEAAGVLQGAIEDFAKEFASVVRRFLKLKSWQDTERIVVGGGFRARRIGELAIGRAAVILKTNDVGVDLVPIRNDPDEAGLIGAVHLVPAWMLKGHDSMLAVDIGGTNFRAGIIDFNRKRAADLSKASVWKFELWRHADKDVKSREEAVARLIKMLEKLIERAEKEKRELIPFIGIGCPGLIDEQGFITRGAQNLPGNWDSTKFNLPSQLREAIPKIAGQDTAILMHNDAVVQGLSEVPFMRDVEHWGVLTIGTGLGNARFSNRDDED
jgi:predicted NBD/HSP70 family sugar kinase